MTNLCGHERSELLCVLRWAVLDDERKRTKERCECGGACCVIYNDLIDPAKLAEMLAACGRQLGLGFWHGPNEPREPLPTDYVLYVLDGVIRLYSPLSPKTWQRQFTMVQARAILLQWLQLPNGAREEAERALRGATCDGCKGATGA